MLRTMPAWPTGSAHPHSPTEAHFLPGWSQPAPTPRRHPDPCPELELESDLGLSPSCLFSGSGRDHAASPSLSFPIYNMDVNTAHHMASLLGAGLHLTALRTRLKGPETSRKFPGVLPQEPVHPSAPWPWRLADTCTACAAYSPPARRPSQPPVRAASMFPLTR